jgi:Ca2+/Na+ antiporter
MTLLMFLAGLVALVIGAELLVRGAYQFAPSFGIRPPTVISLVLVSLRRPRTP